MDVILSEEGVVVMNDCYNGFDEEARRNIQNFMQQQAELAQEQQKQQQIQTQAQTGQTQAGETQKKKPELANWQKVMDNGEYLRSAEMAEEANYNMIDGLVNNTPKKKDKNAPRRSVLKRLRNHQKKIASITQIKLLIVSVSGIMNLINTFYGGQLCQHYLIV